MRLGLLSLVVSLAPPRRVAAPFTATEMMKLKRLADPAVSPDGKWVAYAGHGGGAALGGAQHRPVPRARRGRRAAAADQPSRSPTPGPASAPTASGWPSSRTATAGRRCTCSSSRAARPPGDLARRAAPTASPGSTTGRCSSSSDCAARRTRRSEKPAQLGARVYDTLRPALGHLGGREAQPPLRGAPGRRPRCAT